MEREGKLPDAVCACVGGGSNAMGMFYDFIPDTSVRLLGAEAAGEGLTPTVLQQPSPEAVRESFTA